MRELMLKRGRKHVQNSGCTRRAACLAAPNKLTKRLIYLVRIDGYFQSGLVSCSVTSEQGSGLFGVLAQESGSDQATVEETPDSYTR